MKGNKLERELHKYLKTIYNLLYCKISLRINFVKRLKASIQDYIEDYPESTMDEIISVFGTPQEIADGFIWEADVSFLRNYLFKNKIFIIVTFIMAWTVLNIIVYI